MAKAPADIRSLARSHTQSAINTLVGIMENADAHHAARVSAALGLLDRGWGKPTQQISGSLMLQGETIDRPPRETFEQWQERRRNQLASQHAAGRA